MVEKGITNRGPFTPIGRSDEYVVAATRRDGNAFGRSLTKTNTWDQGNEIAQHAGFTIAIGVQVFALDPHWQ